MFGFMLLLVYYGNIFVFFSERASEKLFFMYSIKIDCLIEDSSGLHFTLNVTICLLSVIRKK